jgi:hypothetical protein
MSRTKLLSKWMTVVIAVTLTGAAQGQNHFKTLYVFKGGSDGATPTDPLVQDSSGNLYGTTFNGGDKQSSKQCVNRCGTVFELSPTGSGSWHKKRLYAFAGSKKGGNPQGPMAMDAAGNLYGTAQPTTEFKLSPTTAGPWTLSKIWGEIDYGGTSWGPDGLTQDANGNLFGVAYSSGGDTIIYELSPSGENWKYTVVYSFGYDNGRSPYNATLLVDSSGNLFGTIAEAGGNGHFRFCSDGYSGCGMIFEFSPGPGGSWSLSDFVPPRSKWGFKPAGSLVKDSDGNLFGSTLLGGTDGAGVVFKLSQGSGGGWKESILHNFKVTKGSSPTGLITDGNGGFYGTALYGGDSNCTNGCGVLFHITQTAQGAWQETVLHQFSGGDDGSLPNQIIRGASGNIFGTTQLGGDTVCQCGTVFEFGPSE